MRNHEKGENKIYIYININIKNSLHVNMRDVMWRKKYLNTEY